MQPSHNPATVLFFFGAGLTLCYSSSLLTSSKEVLWFQPQLHSMLLASRHGFETFIFGCINKKKWMPSILVGSQKVPWQHRVLAPHTLVPVRTVPTGAKMTTFPTTGLATALPEWWALRSSRKKCPSDMSHRIMAESTSNGLLPIPASSKDRVFSSSASLIH